MSAQRALALRASDASLLRPAACSVDPWCAANSAVELASSLLDAQVVALFTLAGERLILMASHGLTQGVLDAVSHAWARARAALAAGQPHGSAELPALVLPCGDERGLAGLIYIEGMGVHRPSSLPLLLPLSYVLARVLRDAGDRDTAPQANGPGAAGDVRAAELYVLMERNEWNVARVARLTGVTRMTIYNRLRRAGLVRKRVAKTSRRGRRQPPPTAPDADTPMAG